MPSNPFARGYFRLRRDPQHAVLWGICAGIAEYFGVSRLVVRLVATAGLVFFTAPTVIAYVIARLVLERRPDDLYDDEREARFWRDARVEPRGTLQELGARMRALDARLRDAEAYVTSGTFRLRRAFDDLERRG
jgi:phage shock protein C